MCLLLALWRDSQNQSNAVKTNFRPDRAQVWEAILRANGTFTVPMRQLPDSVVLSPKLVDAKHGQSSGRVVALACQPRQQANESISKPYRNKIASQTCGHTVPFACSKRQCF